MSGSLRGRLVLLVLAVLGPALGASSFLLWTAYNTSRLAVERQIGEQARALGLVVDRQLGQDLVLLHALETSDALRAGDWQAFDAAAREAVRTPETWVVVLGSDGQPRINTLLPAGAPQPAAPNIELKWPRRLPDGSYVSNLFKGMVSGRDLVATRVDVRLDGGGEAQLAVIRPALNFARIWRDQRTPANWTGVVLDGDMRVITRSRGGASYVGRKASETMQRRLRSMPEGVAATRTLDGIDSITAWSRPERGGWYILLAAPRSEIVGRAAQPLLMGAVSALLLMAAGVGLALWTGRRLAVRIEAVTQAARGLEAGERPRLEPSGVAEIDDLGEAIEQAADRLAGQQSELQDLNASLEARVLERSRELEAATETLVQAQKLEAVGRLTGGVAHDFNNLLTAVSGNLELLRRKLSDERLLRYVEQARQAADRGAKLTGQLLAFSRKQRLEPTPIDVNAVAAQSRDLLGSTLGGAVSIHAQLGVDLWPAMADATQLELVVMNLAINARDAMPSGGVVTIRTANAIRTEPSPRSEGPPAGEFVVVAVSDTGSGMTPDVERRVFEPFFTTKDVGHGSGLGLPQVLGLAKQLGGGVEIDTALGRGTTVRVFLPRADSAAPPAAGLDDERAPSLEGLAVLLVDDDEDVRRVSRALLTELGCSVCEAAGVEEALAAVDSGARIEVVLMDLAMPGVNGAEAAERLARTHPRLPVVMMSGYVEADSVTRNWTGPILHKPFNTAALARELAGAARRDSPVLAD